METFTNVSFTEHKKDDEQISKKIQYEISHVDNDTIFNTSYVNKIENDKTLESFNRLLKKGGDIYQQIGNSSNGNDWHIKEFNNNVLNKEYTDFYTNHVFDKLLVDNSKFLINSIEKKFIKNE